MPKQVPKRPATSVRKVPTRICSIGGCAKGDPAARVAQHAIEALTILPVHSLIAANESALILRRLYKYMQRHHLELVVLGFRLYEVRRAKKGNDG